MRIVISGAAGNLGSKLRAALERSDWCTGIVGIDVVPDPAASGDRTRWVVADLRDPADGRWTEAMDGADAVVHLAAQNPAPDSSWSEAVQSFDMTANLLEVARRRRCRFVYASSNHVMGGYKDAPLPAGQLLGPETPPMPGTRVHDGRELVRPVAYGAMKLLGERAVQATAAGSGGRLTAVNLRIGWCQRGENSPLTLSAHGGQHAIEVPQAPDAEARDLRWFRNMWLSNRDYLQLLERALRAPADWPAPALTVSGVSANRGTPWEHETGRRYLGYVPQDDVWQELGEL